MDISRIKKAVEVMRATGSDDSQYLLVQLRDVEEMFSAWERDQIFQKWIEKIVEKSMGVMHEEERFGEEETNSKDIREDRTFGNSNRPKNGEMGDGNDGDKENCSKNVSKQTDILPMPEMREDPSLSEDQQRE